MAGNEAVLRQQTGSDSDLDESALTQGTHAQFFTCFENSVATINRFRDVGDTFCLY